MVFAVACFYRRKDCAWHEKKPGRQQGCNAATSAFRDCRVHPFVCHRKGRALIPLENQKKLLRHGREKTSIPYRDGTLMQDGAAEHSIDRCFGLFAIIERGEVDCVVVKDLSRLGRDHIAVGYYLEVFFPMNCVRLFQCGDFDTVDATRPINPTHMELEFAFNKEPHLTNKVCSRNQTES